MSRTGRWQSLKPACEILLNAITIVFILGLCFWVIQFLSSAIAKANKGPTPQEQAAKPAIVDAARKAKIEEIASRATVGENTAAFEVFYGSNWVDNVVGSDSYYLYPSDLPLIVDVIGRQHDVRAVGAPQLVDHRDLWSNYTLYIEKGSPTFEAEP